MFALLNARLHLPPFSLFLVALTLTDGKCHLLSFVAIESSHYRSTVMTMTFFFKVTDTGMLVLVTLSWNELLTPLLRFLVRDWPNH